MNDPIRVEAPKLPPVSKAELNTRLHVRPKFLLWSPVLAVGFSLPLYNLVRFGIQSDLYSYILLVPFVSLYLYRQGAKPMVTSSAGHGRTIALLTTTLGATVLAFFAVSSFAGTPLDTQNSLALTTLSFVLLFAGVCAFSLDKAAFRSAIFPLAFLVFMVPFPVGMEQGIEFLLQQGSAPPAYWFFKLAGTPVFREEMIFQLPGISLQIAPECSGIRSTIVLFMTSLVAGHLFLHSPWKRVILTLAVIPLALLRNGFRVFVIGELCVRIGPHMIDSPIHHHGGPIFFLLSLIPFSILTFYLIRSDRSIARSKLQPIAT